MIAKNVAFICGSVLAVTIILTVWDEDVLNVEHLLTVMTVLGAAVAGARVFIPDENLVFCPEKTLTQVYSQESWERLSERIVRIRLFSGDCSHPLLPPAVERSSTHLPGLFKTAHNCHITNVSQVMTELDQLFRYTALFLLDELLSPVVTPLVLIFGLSHRTQVSVS